MPSVSDSLNPPAPPARPAAQSQRAEFRKFLATSTCFLAGFLGLSLALNGILGKYLRWIDHRGGLGGEVQLAIEHTEKKRDSVRVIVLGDSVARQLFKQGSEPGPQVRFLTTNQAITMAGQCYLAEGAFKQCPHITDVYLFYLPAAFMNNMPRDFTHDYFCGHFHAAAQVIEVWKMKRDIELSFAHAGRWLWPNIMAANSLSRPAFSLEPGSATVETAAGETAPVPPDPERLLTQLSGLMAPPDPHIPAVPAGKAPVVLSPVSQYYVAKLRGDCTARGIRLHVLPCPVSTEKNHILFVDPNHIYDGPIISDIPANQLIDSVHFKKGGPDGDKGISFVQAARQRMIRLYGLDFLK
ncbi:MAG TPA: hypothetical protein VFE47_08885 [Tepidisphaeraceae bacterium]|jgi:hypothetical protein|nr:hypothetical protein [Tepidisphaeraceae bacterium]